MVDDPVGVLARSLWVCFVVSGPPVDLSVCCCGSSWNPGAVPLMQTRVTRAQHCHVGKRVVLTFINCHAPPLCTNPQAAQQSKGGVKVVRPMWVSKMTAAPKLGGWQLTGVGKDQGTYGAVVIAHNGKCANR